MGNVIEVCVDTSASLAAAVAGGADRIELCAALSLGGITPPPGLMAEAAAQSVPVMVMIRPRAGDFCWSEAEVRQMEADIAAVRAAGLAGVVLGASLPDGRLDAVVLRRLRGAASGLDCTLHRAFDLTPNKAEALETAVALGFARILTSGGAPSAVEGADCIAALVRQAAGRISIMPGAGVSAGNAHQLLGLGVRELHGSCSVAMTVGGVAGELGLVPLPVRQTDAALVRALRQAVH